VRQLNDQGLSRRAIADRLGVGKDTVRRDLAAIEREEATADAPLGACAEPDAPQASQAVTGQTAPQDAPVAQLPRRVAQPLDGFDVSRWPALRRDLAVLAQTGRSAEALVHQAVTAMAHNYRQALDRQAIAVGQPFIVSEMTLRPIPVAGRTGQAG
jgi:hypothetical protein